MWLPTWPEDAIRSIFYVAVSVCVHRIVMVLDANLNCNNRSVFTPFKHVELQQVEAFEI